MPDRLFIKDHYKSDKFFMNPLKEDLVNVEKKIRFLENLRNAQVRFQEEIFPGSFPMSNFSDLDHQIEETYNEYSLLKIRYMMESI